MAIRFPKISDEEQYRLFEELDLARILCWKSICTHAECRWEIARFVTQKYNISVTRKEIEDLSISELSDFLDSVDPCGKALQSTWLIRAIHRSEKSFSKFTNFLSTKSRIAHGNLWRAQYQARRLSNISAILDFDDLMHIAFIAILDAVDKFDPSRNEGFGRYSKSYSVWAMKSAMSHSERVENQPRYEDIDNLTHHKNPMEITLMEYIDLNTLSGLIKIRNQMT